MGGLELNQGPRRPEPYHFIMEYYGIFWHHPMGTLILFQVLFDFIFDKHK